MRWKPARGIPCIRLISIKASILLTFGQKSVRVKTLCLEADILGRVQLWGIARVTTSSLGTILATGSFENAALLVSLGGEPPGTHRDHERERRATRPPSTYHENLTPTPISLLLINSAPVQHASISADSAFLLVARCCPS